VIRIPPRSLPAESQGLLDELQATIDVIADHAGRVEAAKRAWQGRPRERFQAIRRVLTDMCSGEDRCMYCEDSVADEIEHFRPKSFYPGWTFLWRNYLLACGCCNLLKNDRFGVLSRRTRAFAELARSRGAAVAPPEPGRMMLIDPRQEDPLRFLVLDLVFPFHFHPRHERGCVARARAAYTIEVLQLNVRDTLVRRREAAYLGYRARLREYVEERDPARRARCADALRRQDHPTVWREMTRQGQRIEELRVLFEQAPEALRW
jgi:uncharacterized protein (TIGR02646 family)